MKKGTKIILGVIIGVLVLYSALMTLGVYVVTQDYNDISAQYDDMVGRFGDTIKLGYIDAVVKVIDEDAIVKPLSEEKAFVQLNSGDKSDIEMAQKIKDYISLLPNAMELAEIQTCIICVVDSDDDVRFGYTFHQDGTSTPFLSDK